MSGKQAFFSRVALWPFWLQWAVCTVLALMLFFPLIDNSFVSDDFLVIRKLVQEKQLNVDGFFRPLSDCTLYITYQLFGANATPYYLTGILLHALNVVLLFQFCIRWPWTPDKRLQQHTALFAALLFLTYPFHNESVAWILGRGVLMADTFGMLALLLLILPAKRLYRVIGVCTCYFAGLTAYESIIMLPAMVLVFVWIDRNERPYLVAWLSGLGITVLLHLALRWLVSGSVTGDYGDGFFNSSPLFYAGNFVKAAGRLLLPPSDHSYLMVALTGLLLIAGIFIAIRLRKQIKAGNFLTIQLCCLALAMMLPIMAGVSTRTSESDRFLHFPSYFLCMLMACLVLQLFRRPALYLGCFLLYQVFFLEKNNLNWDKASNAVREVLTIIATNNTAEKIYIVNLPDEIDGAFVFRNGFTDALLLNNIDTASVVIASRLTRNEELLLPPEIRVEDAVRNLQIPAGSQIVFWNRKTWLRSRL